MPAGLLWLGMPSAAAAEASDLIGRDSLSALIDIRMVAADGERPWTDGGFGKARFGGDDDELSVRPVLAEGALIWEPRFSWDVTGTVVATAQHEQDKALDLSEAFLTYKPVPRSALRVSARAGLFWPPVSLEHEGAAWSVSDMITPSAINSWIGEEVKVIGAEATLARESGGHRLAATLGVFGFNDTSGTLLAFRGWALHDLKATTFGHQPLPPLNDLMQPRQASTTKPLIELDGRPGYYAKLSWRPDMPATMEAFYYDNRGDPTAVNDGMQWGWRTRFWNLGTQVDLGERTRLLAQALTGTTVMGFQNDEGRAWVETRYRAAFVRLSHDWGPLTLSGRAELFDTRERGRMMTIDESEEGRALTAAAAWTASDQATLLIEALHIDSERGVRARDGLAADQKQTIVQAGLRLGL